MFLLISQVSGVWYIEIKGAFLLKHREVVYGQDALMYCYYFNCKVGIYKFVFKFSNTVVDTIYDVFLRILEVKSPLQQC